MSKQDALDYRPLISGSDDDIDDVEGSRSRQNLVFEWSSRRKRAVVIIIVVQSILNAFLIASVLYLYSRRGPSNPVFPQLTYCEPFLSAAPTSSANFLSVHVAPVQDLISFRVQKFYEGFGENITIYQRDPSDEVDQAWQDLYSCESVPARSLTGI